MASDADTVDMLHEHQIGMHEAPIESCLLCAILERDRDVQEITALRATLKRRDAELAARGQYVERLKADAETLRERMVRMHRAAPRMFELLDAIVSDDALLDPEQNGAASALLAEIRDAQQEGD